MNTYDPAEPGHNLARRLALIDTPLDSASRA
jgi:hypothetical protein